MTFEQHIYLALIDKLLIGIMLLVLGFFGNRALESFRASQTFRSEMAKTRISYIGETWSAFYTWEAVVQDLVRQSVKLSTINAGEDEMKQQLSPLLTRSEKLSKDARTVAEANRFWLGKEFYSDFMNYNNVLMGYMEAFVRNDAKRFMELENELSRAKSSFDKFIEASL